MRRGRSWRSVARAEAAQPVAPRAAAAAAATAPVSGLLRRAPHPAVALAASDPQTALSGGGGSGRIAVALSHRGGGAPASRAEGHPGTPPAPLVVVAKIKSAMRLVALDEEALRLGLEPGQPLADARAMIPALDAVDEDAGADAALRGALADWAERYTPLVALDGDGLMLDVTGCAHLFGGEAAMVADLTGRLAALGFAARAAIAGSPGAAWAAARFTARAIVAPEETAAMLAPLPMAALRLDVDTVSALDRVGLKRVGQILDAPRAPLAARFGRLLLGRLDRALGREEEAIGPRRPVAGPPPRPVGAERA